MKRRIHIATPQHEVSNVAPAFSFGIPICWIDEWQVEYYNKDRPEQFKGVAIDPNDPPTFESQATY
jgi:hypothetical protein